MHASKGKVAQTILGISSRSSQGGKAQKNGIENGIDYHHCFIIENGIKKATV